MEMREGCWSWWLTYRGTTSFFETPRFSDSKEEFQELLRIARNIKVWPVEIVILLHTPLVSSLTVRDDEAPDHEVPPVLLLHQAHLQLQVVPDLPQHHGVPHLQWPVLPALTHVVLHTVAEHHYAGNIVLLHHQPEVINCLQQRSWNKIFWRCSSSVEPNLYLYLELEYIVCPHLWSQHD